LPGGSHRAKWKDMAQKKKEKNPAAVQLGRLGGKETAKTFTTERGKALAKKRWKGHKKAKQKKS
jgi:hypothetical protein